MIVNDDEWIIWMSFLMMLWSIIHFVKLSTSLWTLENAFPLSQFPPWFAFSTKSTPQRHFYPQPASHYCLYFLCHCRLGFSLRLYSNNTMKWWWGLGMFIQERKELPLHPIHPSIHPSTYLSIHVNWAWNNGSEKDSSNQPLMESPELVSKADWLTTNIPLLLQSFSLLCSDPQF